MKSRIFSIIVIVFLQLSFSNIFAQDVTTVEATSQDISDNLDLEAVASIFGESKDLEDFERRLNDPDLQICNLDLNEDGRVDYLRVLETAEESTHLITIQAVIGKDLYQDVATIDVEKDNSGKTSVQIVGDVYMYGNDYIIEPVYVHQPVFFVHFWSSRYDPWYSPYYYNYYPTYYNPWHPYPIYRYRRYVHRHVNSDISYNYTKSRKSRNSVVLQEKTRRNDFAKRNPDKTFTRRNEGITNRADLVKVRKSESSRKNESVERKESSGRKVKDNWTPPSSREKINSTSTSREVIKSNKKVESRQKKVIMNKELKNLNRETPSTSVEKNAKSSSREIKAPSQKVQTRERVAPQVKVKTNSQRETPKRQSTSDKPERTKKNDRN
ncbi:MAG: hypothetical protein KKF62_08135 [Bacteroidetes bacterium]|nr:hypothetical protein [Bacteroidota bacterium]MBU1115574.1 hypothetical protein [Bacteroidota bacterium]MBU1799644.1 hypothetical protein [Bacteroidota bacterium]